jgi:hypothetical protein
MTDAASDYSTAEQRMLAPLAVLSLRSFAAPVKDVRAELDAAGVSSHNQPVEVERLLGTVLGSPELWIGVFVEGDGGGQLLDYVLDEPQRPGRRGVLDAIAADWVLPLVQPPASKPGRCFIPDLHDRLDVGPAVCAPDRELRSRHWDVPSTAATSSEPPRSG